MSPLLFGLESYYEDQPSGYGNYLVLRPNEADAPYVFMGHLSSRYMRRLGAVSAGEAIGRVGDFASGENGGWSRHVHLQMLRDLPPEGETPIGYSTRHEFRENAERFPNPLNYFPDWEIAGRR